MLSWQEAIQQYLDYIAFERQLSPHTLKNYRRDLEEAITVFANNSPLEVQEYDVRAWLNVMHRKGLARKTIQRRLSALRSFYRYHIDRKSLKHNPVMSIKPPKAEKLLPKVLDVDEVNQLLSVEPESWFEIRDVAIMELLYSSGLRLAEIAALDLKDLDLVTALVKVLGKGNKERLLPIGAKAIQALEAWLAVRQHRDIEDEDALFLSQQGRRISHRSIQARLERLGLKNGASRRLHPHLMRHSFASHVLQSSSDIRAVQELLGHSDISTTQIYTHLDFQHLSKAYDAAHPRAKGAKKGSKPDKG